MASVQDDDTDGGAVRRQSDVNDEKVDASTAAAAASSSSSSSSSSSQSSSSSSSDPQSSSSSEVQSSSRRSSAKSSGGSSGSRRGSAAGDGDAGGEEEQAQAYLLRHEQSPVGLLRAHFTSIQSSLKSTDFTLGATLGTGTFGRVNLVSYVHQGETHYMALKILKKTEIVRLKQVDHIKAEKNILSRIFHPFIVNMLAVFAEHLHVYMLLEYVIGGELFSQLRNVGRFNNDTALFYAAEIVLAFEHLHARNIVYRDLKPENLLIDCDGHIKIADFGFAKVVEGRTWTLCGTPEYLAPEIIQSKGHGKAVDWWALGVLIYEMLAGYPPFYDENPFGTYQKILRGQIEYPKHFNPDAKALVAGLLTGDRTMRLGSLKNGVNDIKTHPWFRKIMWRAVMERRIKAPYKPPYTSPDDTGNFDTYPDSPPSRMTLSPKDAQHFIDF